MNKNAGFSKFNIFSVASVCMLWLFETAAVAPVLGLLGPAFPNANAMQIQLVLTAPFVTVTIFSIISGILAKYFDKKNIMIFGLALYGLSGITPAFAGNITTILVLRFLTGVGVGLILPLSNVIVAENFTGKKRERLLGVNTAVANIGAVAVTLVVAPFLVFGWQFSFYSFIIVFIVLIIVIIGVPKSPHVKRNLAIIHAEEGVLKEKLPRVVYAFALLMMLIWITFGVYATNISVFVSKENMAPLWMLGIIMAFPGTGAFISSSLMPELNRFFKTYLMFVAFFVFGIGYVLMASAHAIPILIIGCLLVGLGSGVLTASVYNLTANRVSDVHKGLAFGLVSCCFQLGAFLSPFYQVLLTLIGHNSSLRFIFMGTGIILIIASLIALCNGIKTRTRAEIAV